MTTTNGQGDNAKGDSAAAATTADSALDPTLDPVLRVDYRLAGDVRRMLNDRSNAVAYGNTDRVMHIDEDLAAAGFKGDPAAMPVDNWTRTPAGRRSGKPDVTSPVVTSTTPTATTPATTPPATSNSSTTGTTPSAP